MRLRQSGPAECEPQTGFGGRIGPDAGQRQSRTRLLNARRALVPLQHGRQLDDGGVGFTPSLKLRARNPDQVVRDDDELIDTHPAGTIQPSPRTRGDPQPIEADDFIVAELCGVPADTLAPRFIMRRLPGNVQQGGIRHGKETRQHPDGKGRGVGGRRMPGCLCVGTREQAQQKVAAAKALDAAAQADDFTVPQPAGPNTELLGKSCGEGPQLQLRGKLLRMEHVHIMASPAPGRLSYPQSQVPRTSSQTARRSCARRGGG